MNLASKIEYTASQNVRSTSNTNTNLKASSSMMIKGQSKTSFKTVTGDITINNPKNYIVSSSGNIAQTSGQNMQVTATAGKILIKSAKTVISYFARHKKWFLIAKRISICLLKRTCD